MPILSVRLTEEELRVLSRRSREAGVKKATFVRRLIRDVPYVTGADVLADMHNYWGDHRLRNRKK
jgi:hypothetical protein